MLTQDVYDERFKRWAVFVQEAVGLPSVELVPHARVMDLQGLLGKLWKLRVHNGRKVVFWKLITGSLPFAERFGREAPCVCEAHGHRCPGRQHHFWLCPAAQAVVDLLKTGLQFHGLRREHVWLMELPPEVLQRYGHGAGAVREVWRVVCLAALEGMWAAMLAVLPAHGRRPSVELLQRLALRSFLEQLYEFVRAGKPPAAWRRLLPCNAPFFRYPSPAAPLQVLLG